MDISRNKSIFSNPCSFKKFSVSMVHSQYISQLKSIYKKSPQKFEGIKKVSCHDKDCYPKTCHKRILERFIKSKCL